MMSLQVKVQFATIRGQEDFFVCFQEENDTLSQLDSVVFFSKFHFIKNEGE